MNLPFQGIDDEPEIIPAKKLSGKVSATLAAKGQDFETARCKELALDFEGIADDVHRGFTRRAGAREPWYARGLEMRNERQLSIVSVEELGLIAERMGLAELQPEWIGANLVIEGVPRLSFLPAGTLVFFRGGVTIKIDRYNAPCTIAGEKVAIRAGMADIASGKLAFPKAAARLRGLVGWVEVPGTISAGEDISINVPEHWIYRT